MGKKRKIVSTNWRLKALYADEINENCMLNARLKAVESELERVRKERISLQTQLNLLQMNLLKGEIQNTQEKQKKSE